jgi:nitrate reductase NapA
MPLGEAFDLVASRLRETLRAHGKDSVAIYGSGAWTIPDAYVAAKFFKGALGTNNVETSARLSAGSAMAGLQSSFGSEGPIGCYEDIDHADVFVLWDANLAETDPVLFSRMLERKRVNPAVRIIHLSTRTTRTSYAADYALLHAPHAALAVAHGVCHEIVSRKWARRPFLDRHVAFKRGRTAVGYGQADERLLADDPMDATWEDYVAFLAEYGPERVQRVSGLAATSIRWLASLYGDPLRKVMSVWGEEINRDVRGTWTNNALYNIHLLVGKGRRAGQQSLLHHGRARRGKPRRRRGEPQPHAAARPGRERGRPAAGGRHLGRGDRGDRPETWRPGAAAVPPVRAR